MCDFQQTVENSQRNTRMEYQTTWPASWAICIHVKKQQLEIYTKQTGSKQEKEYLKAVYCHPAYLTSM